MSTGSYAVSRETGEAAPPAGRRAFAFLANMDFPLFAAVTVLGLTGLFTIQGAVSGVPRLEAAIPRHFVFLWIAIAAMFVTMAVDYRWLNRGAVLLYALNLILLLAVLAVGTKVNDAKRWLQFGPVSFQPSETMKIATVLVCAQWLAVRPEALKNWSGMLVPGILCGVPALLVLVQPDLGTASLFFVMFLGMMLAAGVHKRRLAVIVTGVLIGFASCYPFLKPYQQARIRTFINPESDPMGAGYNIIQSQVAIGSGGWTGRGWGEGTQGTHRFLPEHHTDFIFASYIEQFGFIGGLVLLGLFFFVILRMLRAMDLARDRFGGIVVAGLLATFSFHVFFNIGMTMGVLPVTGLPLPFMSYGGSFLVSMFALIGIVLNVASRRFTFVRP